MSKIINWGVIGCAGIAEGRVLPGLLKASNAKLYAIASRGKSEKLKRFQQEFQPEITYNSYEELLDDPKVEAVYIPLPNGLHYEWVLKAAAKKKHILCEKPLGVSQSQVEQMKAACDKNGVLLMEAFAYRQSPLTYQAKKIVQSGVLGKLQYIESHYGYHLEDKADVRLSKSLDGGATYDIGCYNLNVIRYLVGSDPVSILASGRIGEKSGVDEESSITMEFRDGIRAFSYCSLGVFPLSEYMVVGDKGILKVPYEFNSKGTTKIQVKTSEKTEEIIIECPDNYMLEIEQFGRAVSGEESPLITFEDSLGNATVIDESLRQIFGSRTSK
jgi:D-xylose 1-dehydrogenase (NADP+, D-xylono-1,5-lactone-forming)